MNMLSHFGFYLRREGVMNRTIVIFTFSIFFFVCLTVSAYFLSGPLSFSSDDDFGVTGIPDGGKISTDPAPPVRITETYQKLPLAFEENRGQADTQVEFLSRGHGYTLFLTSTEAVLTLDRSMNASSRKRGRSRKATASASATTLRMRIIGANEESKLKGIDELPGKTNYFIGGDRDRWQTGVPNYGGVRYEAIYPGVDLVFHGSDQRQLEYDFVIAPGTDPAVIELGFKGQRRLTLDDAGDLLLDVPGGQVIERAPVAYQEIDGEHRRVDARYKTGRGGNIGFEIGDYDRDRPLIIDPVLSYSTYLGGSSSEGGNGIAVDATGNVYVTGNTSSTNFPTHNSMQASGRMFVTKLSADGTSIVYSTYFGSPAGSGNALGIAVDASGSAYVVGQTNATDFPTVNPLQATPGGTDAFVAKLSPAGDALIYSTYLGGGAQDMARAIAVDSEGSAYLTGFTFANNFPTTPGAFQPSKPTPCCFTTQDAFVAKLSPAGNSLVYSSYLGGADLDSGNAIAVDTGGNAYVTGTTFAGNFPTANAVQPTIGGFQDVFVTKVSPTGSSLLYSTFLGGTGTDSGTSIAADASGSAYVTGLAASATFPIVNPIQSTGNTFVTKFSPPGTSLVYSTRITGTDRGRGIALDGSGNAYIIGSTSSTSFSTVNAIQNSLAGSSDAFVTKISAAGDAYVYSTYLGGSDTEFTGSDGGGIAIDSAGNAYVTGTTRSTNFPTANALQPANAGGLDAFVAKLGSAAVPVVPVASAGTDQTANEGSTVTLNGAGSSDPNGDALTYHWEQIGGPAVILSNPSSAQPTFSTPEVPTGGATLTFRLTVSDGVNTSEPDTVDITVKNVNKVPVADAGDDQTVQEGSPVTLHGGDSFDADGDPITYQWTQTSGPCVDLSDPSTASPTFSAPLVGPEGLTLIFLLTVNDGAVQTTDEVRIVISNLNQAPLADAGPDQTVSEQTVVALDGSSSEDPDADALTYVWTQVGGTPVTLSNPNGAAPSFTAPDVGPAGEALVFELVVTDGSAQSDPDTVTINILDTNQPPACELARPSVMSLWPPDHKLVSIDILNVTDPDTEGVTITILGVTQDEPVDGLGDGDTSPDAALVGSSLMLRSERSGQGTGRVYQVDFTAQDAAGATCTGSIRVCVPSTRGGSCADEGQTYNSLVP
jgi:hypothetical protein